MTRALRESPVTTTPTPTAPAWPWITRREASIAGLVALGVVIVYVVIAAVHGSLGASRNDDWVYYRAAYRLADTGTFKPDSWSMAMLVGQVVLAQPVIAIFGHSIAALQLAVALLAGVALWAAYLVVRTILPPVWSAFSVACLVVGPIYGGVAVSFMTDVPSYCFQMLALLAGVRAMRATRFSLAWFGGALALGLLAFSIREYAAAATAAVCVAAWVRARRQSARLSWLVAGLTVLWLALAGALYLWHAGLVDGSGLELAAGPDKVSVAIVRLAGFTLALLIIPVVPLISYPRLVRTLWTHKWLGLAAIAVIAWTVTQFVKSSDADYLLGNYLAPYGSYSVTIAGTPPRLISPGLWFTLALLALLSLLVAGVIGVIRVGGQIESWIRRTARPVLPQDSGRTMIAMYCLVTLAVLAGVKFFTTSPLFDRYLFPLVPFVVALVIRAVMDSDLLAVGRRDSQPRGAPAWRTAIALAGFTVFAVLCLGVVDTSAALDGAKWRLAEAVQAQGYPAASVDGGYEWYGYHQSGEIKPHQGDPQRNFWISLFADQSVCATVQYAGPAQARTPAGEPAVLAERTAHSLLGVTYHLVAVAGPQACPRTGDGK